MIFNKYLLLCSFFTISYTCAQEKTPTAKYASLKYEIQKNIERLQTEAAQDAGSTRSVAGIIEGVEYRISATKMDFNGGVTFTFACADKILEKYYREKLAIK